MIKEFEKEVEIKQTCDGEKTVYVAKDTYEKEKKLLKILKDTNFIKSYETYDDDEEDMLTTLLNNEDYDNENFVELIFQDMLYHHSIGKKPFDKLETISFYLRNHHRNAEVISSITIFKDNKMLIVEKGCCEFGERDSVLSSLAIAYNQLQCLYEIIEKELGVERK